MKSSWAITAIALAISILLHLVVFIARAPVSYNAIDNVEFPEFKIISAVTVKYSPGNSKNLETLSEKGTISEPEVSQFVKPILEKESTEAPSEKQTEESVSEGNNSSLEDESQETEYLELATSVVEEDVIEDSSYTKPVGEESDANAKPMTEESPSKGDSLALEDESHVTEDLEISTPVIEEKRTFIPFYKIDSKPQFIAKAALKYPSRAKRLNIEGVVVIEADIDEKGEVIELRVIKRGGFGFDEEALEMIQASSFSPALSQEEPVAVRMRFTVKFKLE